MQGKRGERGTFISLSLENAKLKNAPGVTWGVQPLDLVECITSWQ